MKLLLDTHTFLWWLADDRKLSARARSAIARPSSLVYVSAVSLWEIAIKARLGKLHVENADLEAEIAENGFGELPITARHAHQVAGVPRHHNDPFDHMLVAQAQIEELTLVTFDPAFEHYAVNRLPV